MSAATASEVPIEVDGRKLSSHIVAPTGRSDRCVLFVHGLYSSQSSYIDRALKVAAETGSTCLTFDMSGHGQSPGDLDSTTPRMHLEEVRHAASVLVSHADLPVPRLGVCGASYGAAISSLLLGETVVDRLVLRAPSLIADDEIDLPVTHRANEQERSVSRITERAARYGPETLIVESEFDEVIPRPTLEVYATALRHHSWQTLSGATHALMEDEWDQAFISLLISWFGEEWDQTWQA